MGSSVEMKITRVMSNRITHIRNTVCNDIKISYQTLRRFNYRRVYCRNYYLACSVDFYIYGRHEEIHFMNGFYQRKYLWNPKFHDFIKGVGGHSLYRSTISNMLSNANRIDFPCSEEYYVRMTFSWSSLFTISVLIFAGFYFRASNFRAVILIFF